MKIDPNSSDAETNADIITPHEDSEPKRNGAVEPEVSPGIEDPRHSRIGPEILDPPPHSLPLPHVD